MAGDTGPKEMVVADGNRLEVGQGKGGSKDRRRSGKGGAEPELTGSDSEPEADTPEGTACGTR